MPYNGSGSFSVINTFSPNTTILSALVNQNNTDFASGLSNAMCKDGQQIATANIPMGNFKFPSLGIGSARTDSIDLGQVQDAKTNWVVAGGTADAITATYSPAITALVDGQLCYFRATAANATTTPTFAPNGLTAFTITKVGGTAMVAGDIPGNLAECALRYNLANTRWELVNPAIPTSAIGAAQIATSALGFNEPINLLLSTAVGSSLLAIAVRTAAGTDPSAANPVLIPVRDATVANGDPVILKVVGGLSINTFATGASLGSANNAAFRFWVVCFNSGGNAVLGLINCGFTSQVFPLNDRNLASSTAISGAATLPGVFYTPNGTTVTNAPFCVLGYIEYNATGLVTPGTYTVPPQFVQLAGPHTPRPGATVQSVYTIGASVAITPTSAANLIRAVASETCLIGASGSATVTLKRGATVIATQSPANGSTTNATGFPTTLGPVLDFPNTTGSTTYSINNAGGGGSNQTLVIEELMA